VSGESWIKGWDVFQGEGGEVSEPGCEVLIKFVREKVWSVLFIPRDEGR
jgi:hypothetical protein